MPLDEQELKKNLSFRKFQCPNSLFEGYLKKNIMEIDSMKFHGGQNKTLESSFVMPSCIFTFKYVAFFLYCCKILSMCTSY